MGFLIVTSVCVESSMPSDFLFNKSISKFFSEIISSFDFIISNILLDTHRELASNYARLLVPGGLLLLSGLLGHQKKELFEFILPLGFVSLESKNYQEWASYLFVKREDK